MYVLGTLKRLKIIPKLVNVINKMESIDNKPYHGSLSFRLLRIYNILLNIISLVL